MGTIKRTYADSAYYTKKEARMIVERRAAEALADAARVVRDETYPDTADRRRLIGRRAWTIAGSVFMRSPDENELEAVREAIADRLTPPMGG